jgi:hypothetical protein
MVVNDVNVEEKNLAANTTPAENKHLINKLYRLNKRTHIKTKCTGKETRNS